MRLRAKRSRRTITSVAATAALVCTMVVPAAAATSSSLATDAPETQAELVIENTSQPTDTQTAPATASDTTQAEAETTTSQSTTTDRSSPALQLNVADTIPLAVMSTQVTYQKMNRRTRRALGMTRHTLRRRIRSVDRQLTGMFNYIYDAFTTARARLHLVPDVGKANMGIIDHDVNTAGAAGQWFGADSSSVVNIIETTAVDPNVIQHPTVTLAHNDETTIIPAAPYAVYTAATDGQDFNTDETAKKMVADIETFLAGTSIDDFDALTSRPEKDLVLAGSGAHDLMEAAC